MTPGGRVIRQAKFEDRDAILAVVRAAFSDGPGDGHEEIDIVESTWRLGAAVPELELVAIDHGEVVGHVLAAFGDLGGRQVTGVAPLAVRPSSQGVGIGTELMTELLRRARLAGLPLIVLLGSPAYYRRFGFELAGPLGIFYRSDGVANPHFQVCRLTNDDHSWTGDFVYCWERG
jgi:predicted N-acetyltransferase YhbS